MPTASLSPVVTGQVTATTVAITSTTGKMAGLAAAITPGSSGRLLIIATFDMASGATGATDTVQLSYGTGTAPANGAAVAGTLVGNVCNFTSLTGVLTQAGACCATVSGLTLGTTYWVDLNLTGSASTTQVTNVSILIIEI